MQIKLPSQGKVPNSICLVGKLLSPGNKSEVILFHCIVVNMMYNIEVVVMFFVVNLCEESCII